MINQLFVALKRKLNDLAMERRVDAEIQRNAIKEELQYYVLNFIYHHPAHRNWIMYGGSALRICHGLNRMSVDLDFEIDHALGDDFLSALKVDMEQYFAGTYAVGSDFLTIKSVHRRGLLLRFLIGEELAMGYPSKQIHVKIDLNHFVAGKTVIARIPINHDQLSFVITTYNMSALMASKIAAIFLRGKRGVGKAVYEEKGRDIYDLLWYMDKKIIPDLDYLEAKGVDMTDLRTLFDRLTLQMGKVSDANLRQDLLPLFLDQTSIENWLNQWHESYFHLLKSYDIHTVTFLRGVLVREVKADDYSFIYSYNTEEGEVVRVEYAITWEWVHDEKVLGIPVNESVVGLTKLESRKELSDQLKQFVTLFDQKNEAYFKKTHHVVLGDHITTKTILTPTAGKLNPKEQTILDRSALLSCKLESLLK